MSTDNKHIAISVITTILLIAALLCAMSCDKCPTEPEFPEFRIEISADFVGASRVRLLVSVSDSGDVREVWKSSGTEKSLANINFRNRHLLVTDLSLIRQPPINTKALSIMMGKEIDSSEVIKSDEPLIRASTNWKWTNIPVGIYWQLLADVFYVSED